MDFSGFVRDPEHFGARFVCRFRRVKCEFKIKRLVDQTVWANVKQNSRLEISFRNRVCHLYRSIPFIDQRPSDTQVLYWAFNVYKLARLI